MARPPYHIARQEHVGDALDDLQQRGLLTWQWDYANRRAIYRVSLQGERRCDLDTKQAEGLVHRVYTELDVPWSPVQHPGGESQREAALRKIAALRHQRQTSAD